MTRRPIRARRKEPPTAEPFGPGSAVVVLGLASALAWGAGDFGGGLTSRRAPVLGVSLIVQLLGVVLALGLAFGFAEPVPAAGSILLAGAAGAVGVIGILALYQGLAVGRMGVVAPVTGVIGASLPVVVGIAREGVPAVSVLVGIGLALVAVVLVSRIPGHDGRRSGIEFGLAGGLAIGVFNVLIGGLPEGEVFYPLVAMKLASGVVIAAIVLAGRRPWRVARAVVPMALLVGVLDMGGNAFYVLASQAGRLDVAATLASLYPVTTVLLAILVLRERVTGGHALGILAAGAAIALITSGTAA